MKIFKKSPLRISLSSGVLFLCLFIFSFCYASDPGVPDTIRFEPWDTYIECPPCTGHAIVPMVVYNDEYLLQMFILLRSAGPISCDTIEFVGERVEYMHIGVAMLEDIVELLGTSIGYDSIPPGGGIIAYLYFTVQDTGLASIDTAIISGGPSLSTSFADTYGNPVLPEVILRSEWYLLPHDILPGDVDDGGAVDIVDAVFLINYLFRSGVQPVCFPCADADIDCSVSITDVIYLINYIFKSGPEPQLGCAH